MTILWLVVSIVGLAVVLWILNDAWGDRREVLQSGRNGVLKKVATAQVRSAVMKTTKLTIMTGIGALASLTDSANPWRAVIVPGLITIAVLITTSAIFQWRDRKKVKAMLDTPR